MDFTGVALGSGVNQYMKMDEMARANKKLEMDKALQDQQLARGNIEMDRMRAVDGLNKKYATINQAVARGEFDHPEVKGFVDGYNAQSGAWNNGYTMGLGQDAKGGRMLNFMDKDGAVVDSQAMTQQNMQRMLRDAYMTELSFASPDYLYKNYALGQEDRKLGTDERYKLQVIPNMNTEDRTSRERIAQMNLGPAWANANRGHYAPLTEGYAFDQGTGRTVGPDGRVVTDQATLTRLHKLGAPGKAVTDGPKVKYTTGDGIELQGTQQEIHNWRLANEGPYAAQHGGNNNLAMQDPREQKGTGLKKPGEQAPAAAPTSAAQKAQDFAQKYQGWSRQKAGNDYIVVGPRGERMWASDFDAQNGANSSMMLNYK